MKPIKVGDLVMVVGACCAGQARHQGIQGVPWRVTGFEGPSRSGCQWCGRAFNDVVWATGAPARCPRVWVKWLKRIEGLEELESTNERATVKA